MRLLLIILLGWLVPGLLVAQNDTSAKRKNVFSATLQGQSKLHYFGRTDSLQSSGFFPSIRFDSKTGLYAGSSFIFTNNSADPLAYTGTIVEGGYSFPERRNFSGNLFFNRFLYKDNSQLVQSSLKSQAGINLTYNNKIINVTGGFDAKFSGQTDYGSTVSLDHLFIYVIPGAKKTAIAINPTATANAGTQNFTESYRRNKTFLGIPTTQQETVTSQVIRFKVLSYEASVPVVVVSGKFNAFFTPYYVMPQTLVVVANRSDLTERGKNMFYITAGVGVRL